MSNTPNFASILDRPGSEIEKPQPLPIGTYLTRVVGLPRYDKSAKKQTEFVEFTHQIISAEADVDAEELEIAGGLTNREGEPRQIKNTFYITEASAWRLTQFLEHLGFDFSDDELTLREAAEASANREVYISIKHEPSQDGKSVFAKIGGTASVE